MAIRFSDLLGIKFAEFIADNNKSSSLGADYHYKLLYFYSDTYPMPQNSIEMANYFYDNTMRGSYLYYTYAEAGTTGDSWFATPNQPQITYDLRNLGAYTSPHVTGTATWFIIASTNSYRTFFNGVWGTVGLTGSGADLEMEDVNFVASNSYHLRIKSDFSVNFNFNIG